MLTNGLSPDNELMSVELGICVDDKDHKVNFANVADLLK